MSRRRRYARRTAGATLCALAVVAASGPPAIGAELYPAAVRVGMDWTSTLLWVEVLLAAFSSGLVFGLRSDAWSGRPSRDETAPSRRASQAAAGVEAGGQQGVFARDPGRFVGAAVSGAPKPPIELAMPADTPTPFVAEPQPPGSPSVPGPERHRELYAEEYSRQLRRLKRLRRETTAGLNLAQAQRGQEPSPQLDDSPEDPR